VILSLHNIKSLKNTGGRSVWLFFQKIKCFFHEYGNFYHRRKAAARKLQNPRLFQFHFHTLRHWKATLEYHRTKDPDYVKNLLGHKNIQNADIYRNLEQAIFDERNDKFHSTTAETEKNYSDS